MDNQPATQPDRERRSLIGAGLVGAGLLGAAALRWHRGAVRAATRNGLLRGKAHGMGLRPTAPAPAPAAPPPPPAKVVEPAIPLRSAGAPKAPVVKTAAEEQAAALAKVAGIPPAKGPKMPKSKMRQRSTLNPDGIGELRKDLRRAEQEAANEILPLRNQVGPKSPLTPPADPKVRPSTSKKVAAKQNLARKALIQRIVEAKKRGSKRKELAINLMGAAYRELASKEPEEKPKRRGLASWLTLPKFMRGGALVSRRVEFATPTTLPTLRAADGIARHAVPFPTVAKLTGINAAGAKLQLIDVAKLRATQASVTGRGVSQYLRGARAEAPLVAKTAAGYAILDGHHRATASKLRGAKRIWARVKEFSALRSRVKVRVEADGVARMTLGGRTIGQIVRRSENTAYGVRGSINHSEIIPEFRGMGLAPKLYGETARRLPGQRLVSDSALLDPGVGVWSRLSRNPKWVIRENSKVVSGDTEGLVSLKGHAPVFVGRLPKKAAVALAAKVLGVAEFARGDYAIPFLAQKGGLLDPTPRISWDRGTQARAIEHSVGAAVGMVRAARSAPITPQLVSDRKVLARSIRTARRDGSLGGLQLKFRKPIGLR